MNRRAFLVSAACLAIPHALAQDGGEVVASMSIIADLVRQVGGSRVHVASLVGPDGDAHVFQPSPADARRVAQAKVLFVNGLGLEGWLPRLVQASGGKATTVTLATGVLPIREGQETDPHAWQDVANAKIYVANIRDALVAADPAGTTEFAERAGRYMRALDELDAEIRAGVATIPAARRKIITSHDAFGYFARAYGLTFIAPQGVSTESEASSRDVARIIRQIRAEKIPAVFLENIADPRLMAQVARETGAIVGDRIFSDSLSDADGPAPDYIAMMRHNLAAFTKALR
ncbi:MAG: periplasmic solute binding protein [Hyphomicrobiales bacterium]|nr:periplasmic solute binding protein [Hyphomicrobiales bacterium]